jgi:cellulose synthase (UDP-forming)
MQESGTNELLYVVGFWAFFNLVIAGLGLGAVAERKQRRRHYRMPYAGGPVQAVLEIGDSRYFGTIKDIAIAGLCIEMPMSENPPVENLNGQTVKLSLVKGRRREDRVLHTFNVDVRWNSATDERALIGLEFHEPNALDRRAQALLMFPNSEALARYRANRLKNIKVSQGTLTFVKWSAVQTLRGFKMAAAEITNKLNARFAPAKVATAAAPAPVPILIASQTPEIAAQAHQAPAAAPVAQNNDISPQKTIPSIPAVVMPPVAMPHIPVSPFATGSQMTMAPATPMVHSTDPKRLAIPSPSLVPQANELVQGIGQPSKTSSNLPVARQVPVSGPTQNHRPQSRGQTVSAAPSREVPL